MNKYIKRSTCSLIFFAFILFSFSFGVNAYASAEIKNFTINATINEDGSMHIVEKVLYEFSDEVNGITRGFEKMGDYTDLYVSEITSNGKKIKYNVNENATKGDSNVYNFVDQTMYIYIPSDYGDEKTLEYEYTVKNAATKYLDTSVLYWEFVSSETEMYVDNVRINIVLPSGVTKENTQIFGHGPANGTILFDDNFDTNQTVVLSCEDVDAYQYIRARILFPPSLLNENANFINSNIEDEIKKQELEEAQKAEEEYQLYLKQQAAEKRKQQVASVFAIVFVIVSVCLWIYIYRKYDREYKCDFDNDYYHEPPQQIPPAVLGVLYKYKAIDTTEISATILDLVRRGYLKIENETKKTAFLKKEYDVSVLVRIKPNDKYLTDYEAHLLFWFIDKLGDHKRVTMEDIENSGSTQKSAKQFIKDYDIFKSKVLSAASKEDYFDSTCTNGTIIGVIAGIVMCLIGFIGLTNSFVAFLAVAIAGFALMVYSITIKRRSKSGNESYVKWKAFRKFLLDYSNIKDAPVISVALWEQYLVYAVTLGVAEEVIKQLEVILPTLQNDDVMINNVFIHSMLHTTDTINSSLNNTISHTISTAHATMNASKGSGGSFSSGGGLSGFGGGSFGGGGGHGTF